MTDDTQVSQATPVDSTRVEPPIVVRKTLEIERPKNTLEKLDEAERQWEDFQQAYWQPGREHHLAGERYTVTRAGNWVNADKWLSKERRRQQKAARRAQLKAERAQIPA